MKIVILSCLLFAQASLAAEMILQPGQSIIMKNPADYSDVRVSCSMSGTVPPPPVLPPPPPECSARNVLDRVYTLRSNAERLAAGKCVRSYGVRHCGDNLEAGDNNQKLNSTKSAFRNEYNEVMRAVEMACRDNSCGYSEINRLKDEFERTASYVRATPLVYDYNKQTVMLDGQPQLRCF